MPLGFWKSHCIWRSWQVRGSSFLQVPAIWPSVFIGITTPQLGFFCEPLLCGVGQGHEFPGSDWTLLRKWFIKRRAQYIPKASSKSMIRWRQTSFRMWVGYILIEIPFRVERQWRNAYRERVWPPAPRKIQRSISETCSYARGLLKMSCQSVSCLFKDHFRALNLM